MRRIKKRLLRYLLITLSIFLFTGCLALSTGIKYSQTNRYANCSSRAYEETSSDKKAKKIVTYTHCDDGLSAITVNIGDERYHARNDGTGTENLTTWDKWCLYGKLEHNRRIHDDYLKRENPTEIQLAADEIMGSFMGNTPIYDKRINPIGKIYESSIKLFGRTIPLKQGKWKVIGRGNPSSISIDPFFQLILLKEVGYKKIHTLLVIMTDSMTNSFSGYESYPGFKSEDSYLTVVQNNEHRGAHDGLLINNCLFSNIPIVGFPFEEAKKYLLSNSYEIPKTVIQTLHHFTGKDKKYKFLTVGYFSNPEIEGFDSNTDWHPLRVIEDNNKVEDIERLKKEGAMWHENIRIGFGIKGILEP